MAPSATEQERGGPPALRRRSAGVCLATSAGSKAASGSPAWSWQSRSASPLTRGIRHIAFMDSELAAVDRLVAQQALAWLEIRRLMTVSGVNLICAASFLGAIGEPRGS